MESIHVKKNSVEILIFDIQESFHSIVKEKKKRGGGGNSN